MKKLIYKIGITGLFIVLSMATIQNVYAQFNLGTDIVSRYVWRGIDFGQQLSYQPGFSYTAKGFEIGTWGSFATDGAGANELDLYASFSIDINDGSSISFGLTDYYFPTTTGNFLNFNNNGNHVIEPFLSYSGPVSVSAYMNLINDPDNSMYLNASYAFTVDEVNLETFIGVIPYESSFWYGNTSTAVQEIGLSATKEIPITDEFSLPVFTSYIINPYQEISFLVFGFSL